jgi:hypothetical protein
LRCGAEGATLKTKISPGAAEYWYTDYPAALKDVDRQVRFALALERSKRRLSNQNREDLRNTASTLADDGTLRRAVDLVVVEEASGMRAPNLASAGCTGP